VGSFVFPLLWGLAKDSTGGYQAGMSALPVAFLAGAAIMLGLRQARRGRIAAPA
jgi:MFS-type transporter involved in bile tolerance (Atg22 family)